MKTSQKRLVLVLLASALWALAGTSCNTVRGFGRDVERTGEHIQSATH
jgi:predicted small secreted protein